MTPRRERARAATIEEIKATALELMREQRTTDIRFTDIAKGMGVTPPALYRYFDSRDDLLTVLITDAYDELGARVRDAIAEATSASASASAQESRIWAAWVAAGQAYRRWASEAPERFALILGMPVPGYVADEEGPTTEAAKGAMSQLSGLFFLAQEAGQLRRPLIHGVDPALAACADEKHPEMGEVLDAEVFQAMLQAWAGLHGFTSLEAYGHLDWLGPQARDALFVSQLRLIATFSGLPTDDATP
jgi:AcrR family transcriptional regulator